MKKRVIKLIVCVMLISALMIGFCTAYASAATPVWLLRAKAGIAAAMMAANLVFEPVGALEQQALGNAIDPLNIVQQVTDTAWTDYIDQSVIVVRPDKVTIDGVPYSEIWLGSDATNALRASGFDFQTVYNILSNQSEAVSYAEGLGYVGDTPFFDVNGVDRTPAFVPNTVDYDASYDGSGYVLTLAPRTEDSYTVATSYPDGTALGHFPSGSGSVSSNRYPYKGHYLAITGEAQEYIYGQVHLLNGSRDSLVSGTWRSDLAGISYNTDPFEFDYTSGNINTDPISDEQGLLLRVPSSYNGGQGSVYNYDIHDLVNLYPQVDDTGGHELVFDPSLNPDFDVDLDMGNALGDIITAVILAKLADLLGDNTEVVYAPMPEKDEPGPQPGVIDPLPDPDPAPDEPVPGSTIADTDWTKLDEILRWIQSTIDSIRHLTESLQTMLDSIFDAIQSVIQHIAEIPEAIRELADKILEDIELGPSKLFDKAIDILKTLFLPLLLPIRTMMNLWHYVVEWIQSITTPFTWIFGIMSGTSGNMVLPIYALLAGGICISIYKALGR